MIKSYTDIEQSKKLAEILPLESADMAWYPSYAKEGYSIRMLNNTYSLDIIGEEHDDIPAWSLAALINIIPQEIFDGEYIINITEGCNNRWILTYDYYDEDRNHSYYGLSTGADNLVDVCTDIIIKLKERNII